MITEKQISQILHYLRRLNIIVFISMAIISVAAVFSFRSASDAAYNARINTKVLTLVEKCVVYGECDQETGNPDPTTLKVVDFVVDSLGCILLIEPTNRSPEDIKACKIKAAQNGN